MSPTFERLDDLTASLVRASWQGSLAILAAWLLLRCARRLPPRVACWLWRLADLKLVVALFWAAPVLLPLLPPVRSPTQRRFRPPLRNLRRFRPAHRTRPLSSPLFRPPSPNWLAAPGFLAPGLLVVWRACRRHPGRPAALAISRLRRSCMPVHEEHVTELLDGLANSLGLR